MAVGADPLVEVAASISRTVLKRWAAEVDAEGRFPRESIQALREAGLMGYFVPARLGGQPGNLKTYFQIAAALGEECLSTAMVWAMHAQQIVSLADHAAETHAEHLEAVARAGILVGSVTSEYEKGGDLLTALAPLVPEGPRLRLSRSAPYVTAGAEAGLYLITMKSGEESPPTDVRLVCVTREDGDISFEGEWNSMGMRGTVTVPMRFDVTVDRARVVTAPFRQVAIQSMIPAGHIGWTACWFGAARGAVRRFVRALRASAARGGRKLTSDLLMSRLACVRVSLDLIEAMLNHVSAHLDDLRLSGAPAEAYEDIKHNILVNNLKVAGSTLAFSVADRLIELSGLSQGYLKDTELGFERTFRDLRSASLMVSNDRLLEANGKLILAEGSEITKMFSR